MDAVAEIQPVEIAVLPGSEVKCSPPEGPNAECLESACDPLTGDCQLVLVDEEMYCKDGNPCTILDECVEGVCMPGPELPCDDGNPCTDDWCDPLLDCVFAANNLPCDDGSVCTENDACSEGACAGGEPIDCDDGNPCTDDWCQDTSGCQAQTNNELTCDGGFCFDGVCIPDSPEECDDDNICTTDSLDPDQGCSYTLNKLPCDDGNPCTIGDNCHLGACISCEQQRSL